MKKYLIIFSIKKETVFEYIACFDDIQRCAEFVLDLEGLHVAYHVFRLEKENEGFKYVEMGA